ncbi:hypothetical protein L211DRAFT_547844 [Terfezia boudieri ATCC MYA-4762]|uniref:Uncharacterized protein n=1 Tax=Terfezia boudieri ATCC MYA-4762 TaxID=1051890 RepID=A0A3N4M0L6_9PEZI|nr:hypothetical protein L211DRAFT_547844 [Terfezia boudieri ATCC MYA-4762]
MRLDLQDFLVPPYLQYFYVLSMIQTLSCKFIFSIVVFLLWIIMTEYLMELSAVWRYTHKSISHSLRLHRRIEFKTKQNKTHTYTLTAITGSGSSAFIS